MARRSGGSRARGRTRGRKPVPQKTVDTKQSQTTEQRGRSRSHDPFDVIQGTIADQLLLPFIFGMVVIPGFDRAWWSLSTAWFGRFGHLLVGAFFFLSGMFLTVYTYLESESRSQWVKWRFTATTAWFFITVPVTMILGGMAGWIGTLELVGCVFALWWVIAGMESVTGSGRDTHREDGWDTALGMPGARPGKITGDDISRTIDVTHPDQTHREMGDTVPRIIAKGGFPVSGVRYVPGKVGGHGRFVIVYKDILSKSIEWEGPSKPGASIAEPLRIGRKMSVQQPYLTICRIGPSGAIHSLRVGMTGSGKTSGLLNELMDACTRVDVVYWLSDTLKGAALMPWIGPAIDWFAKTLGETKAQIAALGRIISARMDYLASVGLREWKPGCGLPFLVYVLEEAARVVNDLGEQYIRLLEGARSAGISIDTSMQRASGDNLDTDARGNFGMGWMFGTKYAEDAPMVLSEETLDSGADPAVWKAFEPGKCYLEMPGQDADEWATPARTYNLPDELVQSHILEWAPKMCPLDEVSANAAGEQYAKRVRQSSGPSTMLPFTPRRLTKPNAPADDFSWIWGGDSTPDNGPTSEPDNGSSNTPEWGTPGDNTRPRTGPQTDDNTATEGTTTDDNEWHVPTDDDDDDNDGNEEHAVFDSEEEQADFADERDELRDDAKGIGRVESDDDDEYDADEADAERIARQEMEDNVPMDDLTEDDLIQHELGNAFTPGDPLDKRGLDRLFVAIATKLLGDKDAVTVKKSTLVDLWFDTPGTADDPPSQLNFSALDRRLRRAERVGAAMRARHGYWTLTRGVYDMTFTPGDSETDDE